MNRENNAQRVLRLLMLGLADVFYNNKPLEEIDRLPVKMFPRAEKQDLRCCIYKARAIVRYRLLAMLGFDIAREDDELKTLAAYAAEGHSAECSVEPVLTVIDEACSSCIRHNYYVTDACRGCLARPCIICPKGAISIVNGKSVIDGARCVNCGLCEKVCPYNAIVNIPVPCEKACPVKAISKDGDNRIIIDHEACILCGRCIAHCPFGAVMERSHLVDVIKILKSGRPAAAILAPAIAGQFSAPFEKIAGAVKALGFTYIAEASAGAETAAVDEAHELNERIAAGAPLMTTSCCPAWVHAAKQHLPEIAPLVSHTPSPMIYTARMSKEKWPGVINVFIGPCTAKRREASRSGCVEYVLTFEELSVLLSAAQIVVDESSEIECDIKGSAAGRRFASAGGASRAVLAKAANSDIVPFKVNGLGVKEMRIIATWSKIKAPGNFCEVMACEGGCIAGPGTFAPQALAVKRLEEYASGAQCAES